MAEKNVEIVIETHTFKFPKNGKLPDREFTACLGDVRADVDAWRTQMNTETNAKLSHWEALKVFVGMVEADFGVTLTGGEADRLIDAVDVAFEEKKSADRDAWQRAAKSRPSMDSTPAS